MFESNFEGFVGFAHKEINSKELSRWLVQCKLKEDREKVLTNCVMVCG